MDRRRGATARAHGTELQLVIAQVGEKRPVGSAALRLRDDPEPHGEIGYWVAAGARRAGVGRRAVRLLARHGLQAFGLAWIEIAVSPAQRGVARAGAERRLRAPYRGATRVQGPDGGVRAPSG